MAVRQAKSAFGTDTGTEATHGTLPNNPGSYSGAIVAGDLNQNISRQVDDASTFLIRFLIQCDGGSSASNAAPQFQYDKNSAGFVNITTTSANIKAVTPTAFANAAATTLRMGGTGTTDASNQGCTTDGLSGGAQMDIPADGQCETVCGVQLVPADIAAGDTLDLRISGPITVYDFTPRITITALPAAEEKSGTDAVAAATSEAAALASDVAGTDAVAVGLADAASLTAADKASSDSIAAGTSESGQVSAGTQKESSDSLGVAVADSGVAVLTEAVLPDTVISASNLQDTGLASPPADTADIDDDPGSPDGDWWTAVTASVGTSCIIGFATPVGGQPTGQQRFQIWLRKTEGDSDPLANAWLREDGSRVRQLLTDVPVTSTTGQMLEPTWNASEISLPSGANVELELAFTAGAFVFDNTEAETLVSAMTVAPDNTRKSLIDDLVGSLKTAGVWTKLDALWVCAAHDAQAARLNWIAPGVFDLTVGGGTPVFTIDRHYATNGSNSWLDTNFNPTTASSPKYAQNSASAGVWVIDTGQVTSAFFGWFDGTDGMLVHPRNTSDQLASRINQTTNLNVASVTNASGLSVGNRTASNAIQIYKNGSSVGTGSNASTALNNHTFQAGLVAASTFSARQMAVAFIGQSLDGTENAALHTALSTYLTAVGAI